MINVVVAFIFAWIGAGIHMWLSYGKIRDLYARIDELERSQNGFINEPTR